MVHHDRARRHHTACGCSFRTPSHIKQHGLVLRNLMVQRDSDDRLSGWLQRPAGDPVCRDPPASGHHTGLICRGSLPYGSCRERPEFNIKPSVRTPLLIFPRGYLLKSLPQDSRELKSVFHFLGELKGH